MRSALINRFQFPARPPKLDYTHPVMKRNAGRFVGVFRTDGSTYDLLTGKSAVWSLGAGRITPWGPAAYPKTTSSGGIIFPALIPNETLTNGVTLAMICWLTISVRGHSPLNISNSNPGNGIQSLQILQPTATFNMGLQGFNTFDQMPNGVIGHCYFLVVSQFNITGHPRIVGTLLDMTTGQITICHEFTPYRNYAPQLTGTSYGILTYSGGAVDNNPILCEAISATPLTQSQQLAWCDDPWGLWYAPEAPSLMQLGGRRPTGFTSIDLQLHGTTIPPIANFSLVPSTFHFPPSPTLGQQITAPNAITYQWDGTKWVKVGTSGAGFVPTAGGTMTGPLTLASGAPVGSSDAAPKTYVDNLVIDAGTF